MHTYIRTYVHLVPLDKLLMQLSRDDNQILGYTPIGVKIYIYMFTLDFVKVVFRYYPSITLEELE